MKEFLNEWALGLLATILTAAVTWCFRQVRRVLDENALMREGQQTLMVHEMVVIYNDALNRGGWLTETEYTEAKALHDIYHRMGWNHKGDLYFELCMKMPVKTGAESDKGE